MSIPLNGRIAIIDDKYEHAYPLMELFGKLKSPYLYYNGSLTGLPDEGDTNNDIRILFLDIYLTGDDLRTEKQIVSTLVPVINRVISANNYPYLLVFWSRHDRDHDELIKNIFNTDLKNKAPISFLSLQKTDFFEMDGSKTILHDKKKEELLSRVKGAVTESTVYGNLMAWENLIHQSADSTLEEIFKLSEAQSNWHSDSSYLFTKLATSYSGKNFKKLDTSAQIKSGFYALNSVFNDSLEYSISSTFKSELKTEDVFNLNQANGETIPVVNKKLLFADESFDKISPGIVSLADAGRHHYEKMLHSAINIRQLISSNQDVINQKLNDVNDANEIERIKRRAEKDIISDVKKNIRVSWLTIETNVTPICDFVQDKEEYSRLVPGLLIASEFKKYIDDKSEALFISPNFKLVIDNEEIKLNGIYFLLLDFRFFNSLEKESLKDYIKPFLRIRQQLLTEIQSKLSRHVNRQGVLFVED